MWVARVEQQSNCVLVLIAGKFTDTLTHKPNIFISHPPHQTWQFDIHFGWIPGSSVLTTELPNDSAAQLVRAWQIICWVKDLSPSLFPGPSSFISHSSICNEFGQVEGPEHVYNWAYICLPLTAPPHFQFVWPQWGRPGTHHHVWQKNQTSFVFGMCTGV